MNHDIKKKVDQRFIQQEIINIDVGTVGTCFCKIKYQIAGFILKVD